MTPLEPMYSLHERIWHWLQALAMILLILTGFSMHYAGRFTIFGGMKGDVLWHSWIGFFLILNALLGIFYHFTADKYHHYIPRMDDFTTGAIKQIKFYLFGIFKGEKHPMETDPRKKLNSLQKLTYLGLLGVLIPFQIVTGVMMWGATRWPEAFAKVGGMKVLAPAHTLGAYLFLAFIIVHVYLTTTGNTPFALLRAMITGYQTPKSERE